MDSSAAPPPPQSAKLIRIGMSNMLDDALRICPNAKDGSHQEGDFRIQFCDLRKESSRGCDYAVNEDGTLPNDYGGVMVIRQLYLGEPSFVNSLTPKRTGAYLFVHFSSCGEQHMNEKVIEAIFAHLCGRLNDHRVAFFAPPIGQADFPLINVFVPSDGLHVEQIYIGPRGRLRLATDRTDPDYILDTAIQSYPHRFPNSILVHCDPSIAFDPSKYRGVLKAAGYNLTNAILHAILLHKLGEPLPQGWSFERTAVPDESEKSKTLIARLRTTTLAQLRNLKALCDALDNFQLDKTATTVQQYQDWCQWLRDHFFSAVHPNFIVESKGFAANGAFVISYLLFHNIEMPLIDPLYDQLGATDKMCQWTYTAIGFGDDDTDSDTKREEVPETLEWGPLSFEQETNDLSHPVGWLSAVLRKCQTDYNKGLKTLEQEMLSDTSSSSTC